MNKHRGYCLITTYYYFSTFLSFIRLLIAVALAFQTKSNFPTTLITVLADLTCNQMYTIFNYYDVVYVAVSYQCHYLIVESFGDNICNFTFASTIQCIGCLRVSLKINKHFLCTTNPFISISEL